MNKSERLEAILNLPVVNNLQKKLLALLVLERKTVVRLDLDSYQGTDHNIFKKKLYEIFEGVLVDDCDPDDDEWGRTAVYYVGNTFLSARTFRTISKERDATILFGKEVVEPAIHICCGALLGYPASSSIGYANGTLLPIAEYPEDFKNRLFTFLLSAEHWQKEVEFAKSWLRVLEDEAPDIAKLYINKKIASVAHEQNEEG
jgi:hypothetical protein